MLVVGLRRAARPVEVVLQRAERTVPVAGQRGQELLSHLHRGRAQPVAYPAPLSRLGHHQPRLGEQGKVLGDRLPRDRQAPGQVRGRGGTTRRQFGRMARRLGSASAAKTCSAIASMSGGIEVADQVTQLARPALGVTVECLAWASSGS